MWWERCQSPLRPKASKSARSCRATQKCCALWSEGKNRPVPSPYLVATLNCFADAAANWIFLCLTPHNFLGAAEIHICLPKGSTGPIMAYVLLPLLVWPPILVLALSRLFCLISSMYMIGRPRLRPLISTTGTGRGPGLRSPSIISRSRESFSAACWNKSACLPKSFTVDGVEYYGDIGFLKAGLQFADMITTVSPTYALEIQSDEGGMGLGGLLRSRSRDLRGILNGIDAAVWDPTTDVHIQRRFDASTLECRTGNKAALQKQFGLKQDPDALLLGVISRLSGQKGLDLLLECIPTIQREGIQLALLGSGDAEIERRFRVAADAKPETISVVIGFDEILAHQIQAGVDALVVPSRFEPCGTHAALRVEIRRGAHRLKGRRPRRYGCRPIGR